MPVEKIKNFFLSLFKKKTILFVFFFSFFGLFFARSASANWLLDLVTWLPTRAVLLIVWLITELAILIVGLSGSLLNWVIGPNFTKLSYTDPGTNPIIDTGLKVTQGFVNMLLILILVYIAIATILRLAGYETKKLLVTFIVVALLVNFAPVICGLIVDASNIVMNFFVQDLSADAFGNNMGRKVTDVLAGFDWTKFEVEGSSGAIFQLVFLSILLFILTFILLLFTAIFMFRYLVIWLLVILSPLAFACYILPITRKYFTQWWQQFINWSFIGVTCGFFLYLGLLLVTHIPNAISTPTTGQDVPFNAILPFFVSIAFLGIGIVFGLSTSAAGASTIIGFAKTKGKGIVKGTGKGVKWVGKKAARGLEQQLERTKIKQAVSKVTKAVERVPGARWFLPEPFRKYGEFRPKIDAEQKKLEPYSSREISHRIAFGTDIGTRATGGIVELVKRGDMQDLVNAYKKKLYGKKAKTTSDEELFQNKKFLKKMESSLQAAFQGGYQSKLLRSDPRIARVVAGKKWAGNYKNMTSEQAVKQASSEARRPHIAQWEREVLEDKSVMDNLVGRGREIFEAIDTQVKRGQETSLKIIDKMFSDYIDTILTQKAPSIAQQAKAGKPAATKAAWGKFKDYYKKSHQGNEGYFKALEKDPRFTARGWRMGQYTGTRPATPPPGLTPGAATMGGPPPGPPPPKGKRPGAGKPKGRKP